MSADTDLLAMLDASDALVYVDEETGGPNVANAVYWGYLNVDEAAKVIDVPMPYIVFNSSPGYDRDERQSGSVGGVVLEFQLTGVGESERQAKWILTQAYEALNRKRLNGSLIKRALDNQQARRDDDYTRPGNKPIFYAVDRYAVAL
jgi:hypothetical protein